MKKTHILAAGAVLAVVGIGIAVATTQQDEQSASTSALRNMFATPTKAPTAQGPALLVVGFDPELASKTLFELSSTKSNHIPESKTLEMRQSVLPAASADSKKIALITPYYDAEDQKNNAELAMYRAQMVANELSGLGLSESRIVVASAVALSGATLPDVHKVEIRLQ